MELLEMVKPKWELKPFEGSTRLDDWNQVMGSKPSNGWNQDMVEK